MKILATVPNKGDFGTLFYVLFQSTSNFHLQKQVRIERVVRDRCHQCPVVHPAQGLWHFGAVDVVQVSNKNFPKVLQTQGAGVAT